MSPPSLWPVSLLLYVLKVRINNLTVPLRASSYEDDTQRAHELGLMETFSQMISLEHHPQSHHQNTATASMPYRDKTQKKRTKGPVDCSTCDKQFDKPCDLRAHMRDGHGKRFECEKCEKTFAEPGNLAIHETMHNAGPYRCSSKSCSKIFRKAASCRKHEKIHDPNREKHICQEKGCGREYAQKVGLNRHIKLVSMRYEENILPAC